MIEVKPGDFLEIMAEDFQLFAKRGDRVGVCIVEDETVVLKRKDRQCIGVKPESITKEVFKLVSFRFNPGCCYQFRKLIADVETGPDEIKRMHTDEALGYYYFNPDAECYGFGFNIADGGGFLPESDVTDDVEITEVVVQPVPDMAKAVETVNNFDETLRKTIMAGQVFDPST